MPDETITDSLHDIFEHVHQAPLIGPQQLCVLGGCFPAARLPEFVALWGEALAQHLDWRIYEHVSRLSVERSNAGIPLADLSSLERARCFGTMGDLDLRRDLATIHWHFIGAPAFPLPDLRAQKFEVRNYWEGRETSRLRQFHTQTVQWRRNDGRVGGAWLEYSGTAKDQHIVFLNQTHYVRAGCLEFARLTGFEVKESNDGNGHDQKD